MRHKNLAVLTALALPALTHLSALAQCPTNVPHITGTWTVLPYQMPINPISANLLPNGKVLIVAGSENDASKNSRGAESYRAAVWDPSGTNESSISVQNLTYDVFCSGTAALFDGRSLIVGGTSDYSFAGENRASIFNPATSQYVQSQNMVDGRWYATATALADGRIMAMSGLTQTGGTSQTIEIYDLQRAGAGWNPPTSVPFGPPLYPRLELLPGGRVFYTGHGSGPSSANAWIFDPATGGWTQSATTSVNRSYGSSVLLSLLPPSHVPRGSTVIVRVGGLGTMQTSTSTVPYALSLTITGTSGTISHTASTTLLINLAPPAGLTATAGDAQVSLSWQASVGQRVPCEASDGSTAVRMKRLPALAGPALWIADWSTEPFITTPCRQPIPAAPTRGDTPTFGHNRLHPLLLHRTPPTACQRTLTIDHTKVPSTQSNFTVLVSVTDPALKTVANGGHVVNANGYDIGFYADSGGTTKLKWEVEKYDGTAGNLIAWVKIPSVSSSTDTVFYLMYGDSSINTDQSDPPNTWDLNFKAVWHLGNGSTLSLNDSTSNGNGLANVGATGATTGKISGGAGPFNGTSQCLKTISSINLGTNKVTLSAWVNITGYTNSNFAALAQFASTNWCFDNNSLSSTPNEAGTWGVWASGNGGLITEENSPGRQRGFIMLFSHMTQPLERH